jgi:ABC-type glycerol-3-phosphate transport system substrate-binding protein
VPDYYEQPAYLRDIEVMPVNSTQQPTPTQGGSPRPSILNNRRNLLVIAAIAIGLIVFLVILVASRSNNSNNQTPTTPTGPINLQWWGVFLEPEVIQPLIDEYEADNTNVNIEYANKWPGGSFNEAANIYQSELNRVLRENDQVQIPDIFMVQNTWSGDYEKVTRASTSYDYQTFSSTFYDAVVTDFTHDNKVYGVPLWIDTLAVLYNKDMLASIAASSPGTTWTSFKTQAQQLTKRTGNNITQAGLALGYGENVSFAPEVLYILLSQNGVEISDSDGSPIFSTSPETATTMQYYKSFIASTDGTWNDDFANDAAAFLEEKAAMIFATSYRYRDILKFNELYDINIDIGIAPIPQLEGSTLNVNWADYWGNMVALNRPNATAAWQFLRWLTQPEQLRKLHDAEKNRNEYFGTLFPRRDMAAELQTDPTLKVFNDALPNARSWYQVKGLQVEKEINDLLSEGTGTQSQIAATENAIQTLINQKGRF